MVWNVSYIILNLIMNNALIGYTGFVGSAILSQMEFSNLYRSTNIAEIDNKVFDTVICAGAPGQKWLANQNPEVDAANINTLIDHLKTITCSKFILISTVDVYKNPIGVNENTRIVQDGLHAYGLNRRILEQFVMAHFDDYLIVRLPGLVGIGLRKNVIYDLKHNNNIDLIDEKNVFQFYPMDNIVNDIRKISRINSLKTINFSTEPVLVKHIAEECFGIKLDNKIDKPRVMYDMQSVY